MKNLTLIFVLLLASSLFAGTTAFPIFDWDRGPWMGLESRGIPINVESGTHLGLTNPGIGETFYSFKFEILGNDLSIDLTPRYMDRPHDGCYYYMYENNLILEGIHIGAGSPIEGFRMDGNGIVNVYERDFLPTYDYTYLGQFTVGNTVPEPTSIALLSVGSVLFLRRQKR